MVKITEVPNAEVSHLTQEYVGKVHALNSDPYFQEAAMRFAVRELAWEFLEKFGDQHALADQLRLMADAVEEHKDEDEKID